MRDYERYGNFPDEPKRIKKKKRKSRNFTFFVFFLLLIICVVMIVSTTVFFNIENTLVEGESLYTKQQIIAVTGIIKGNNLFSINTKRIEEDIVHKLPYIKAAKIVRQLPSTVLIKVEMDKVFYAIPAGGGYILLSRESKVLSTVDKLPEGIPAVKGMDIKSCNPGYAANYGNPELLTTAVDIINAVSGSGLKGSIVQIDLKNEFDIKLKYTDRFDIMIGNSFDITRKINFAEAVIERLASNDRGTISVMGEKASFLPYSDQEDNE